MLDVQLSLTRDFSRLAYKATKSKTSSFIRVQDISGVNAGVGNTRVKSTLSALKLQDKPCLLVKAKGAKEFLFIFKTSEEQSHWLKGMDVLLANRNMLTSFKTKLAL